MKPKYACFSLGTSGSLLVHRHRQNCFANQEPGRSRVIPVTRERQVLLLMEKLLENELLRKERKNGDRAEMDWVMDMEWMESKPPPVSIEDRTVVGSVDQV